MKRRSTGHRSMAAFLGSVTLASLVLGTSARADVISHTITLPVKLPSVQVTLLGNKLFTPSLRNLTLSVSLDGAANPPVPASADPATCDPGFQPLIGLRLDGGEASVGSATVTVSGESRDPFGKPIPFEESLTSSPNKTVGPIGPGALLDICVEGSSPASITTTPHNDSPYEDCNGSLTTVQVADNTLYLDDRDYLFGGGIWLYVESNGEPGLQRGGRSPLGDYDFCGSSSNPDLLIF